MLFQALATLLGCVLAVECRDTSKTIRSIPSITSSLVNLGKMDISFHFNTKDAPVHMEKPNSALPSFRFSKSEPIEEPCLCSSLRNHNNFLSQSSDLLSKVLMNNDLFSFKDPISSTMCCGSHEHGQEDILTFEFGPKPMNLDPPSKLPNLPFIFENLFPKKPLIPTSIPGKPKAVEIFLLPKKQDYSFYSPKKEINKDTIQIVGDKELRNDFRNIRFRPSFPINVPTSVKKDLTTQDKNETQKQIEKEEVEVTTNGGAQNAI